MLEIENILWQARFQVKTNWLRACKILENGIREFPETKELYVELANIYIDRKLSKKSIEVLQNALKIDKNDSSILFKIANSFLSLKEYGLAIFYYDQINEYFPEALYNKAVTLARMGKNEESISALENLIRIPSDSILPYLFLIEEYISQKYYHKAISLINSVETGFGKTAKLAFFKGIAYFYQDNWLKAYVEFNLAEKMEFKNPNFYRIFGICCEKIGKTETGIEYLLKSIKMEPFNVTNYLELIKIYLTNNRLEDALVICQHARKISPVSASISMIYNKIVFMLGSKNKDKDD
ncbi:MAG: tetratricopeptide repeat protein [Candidatus Cloacimonetes bacterium]|nr:tetratricopeptide repeat protein [Candidatus Cloacimonadota bacterium]